MNFPFRDIDASGFDSHIDKSIPGFNLLDDLILNLSEPHIARSTIKDEPMLLDLGASTGRFAKKFIQKYPRADMCLVEPDVSFRLDMLRTLNQYRSILEEFDPVETSIPFDLVTSVFTLQFIPTDEVYIETLEKMCNALNQHGALFLAEKIRSPFSLEHRTALNRHKLLHFTTDEILSKEMMLSTTLFPRTAEFIEDQLDNLDMEHRVVWSYLDFRCYMITHK